jgi:ribosomal protein S1
VPGASPDLEDFVGRSLTFHVIDVRGREAIVSRRAIAEAEAREGQARALASLREGDVYTGVVTGIRPFGAFVRILPGVEGLVHLSNLSTSRVSDPATVVKEGQEVRVRVLSIESARGRINLGIRQADESLSTERPAERADTPAAAPTGFGLLGSLLQDVRIEARKPAAKAEKSGTKGPAPKTTPPRR